MWNSFSTDAPAGISAGVTTYAAGNGDQTHAYVARPEGSGPFPGIVLVHHMPGWDEFYQEMTRRFANHGYIAICPDLYCREGHGMPDDIAAKVRARGGVSVEPMQLAALLLEKKTEELSEREAESLVPKRHARR